MQVAVVHPGTQHSWQTAYALQQLERLQYYATSIFYQPDRWPYRIERYLPASLRARVHSEFRRFSHSGLDPRQVRTSGIYEWLERIVRRQGYKQLALRIDRIGNQHFARSLTTLLNSKEPYALWSYDNAAHDLFGVAKEAGRTCILDRTIGDFRAYDAIMGQVYQDYPEFFLGSEFRTPTELIERNQAEYEMADTILTGSPFAAQTVRDNVGDPKIADRVRVLNYCFDEALFGNRPAPRSRKPDEPLRFLFVGLVGVRKGIHLVLKAMDRIPASAATLKIVGDLRIPASVFARYADRVTYVPTVARADMPEIMSDADVLLFPSYFEGSALSLIEGLASGLALIQSPNAGCGVTPDTGIMLADQSEEAVYEAMMHAIDNRHQVQEWRNNAQAEAQKYTFSRYRDNIASMLEDIGC